MSDHFLEYRDRNVDVTPESAVLALFLCTPGLICWIAYAAHEFIGLPMVLDHLAEGAIVCMLIPALATAILSIWMYVREITEPKRWWILINLFVNITGLVFLILMCGNFIG